MGCGPSRTVVEPEGVDGPAATGVDGPAATGARRGKAKLRAAGHTVMTLNRALKEMRTHVQLELRHAEAYRSKEKLETGHSDAGPKPEHTVGAYQPPNAGAQHEAAAAARSQLHGSVLDGVLTEEHLAFFYKYGFVLVRGLTTPAQVKKGLAGAQKLIKGHQKAKDAGKGEHAFGSLPEGSRSTWGRCTEPKLMQLFTLSRNMEFMKNMIGKFQFKHHDGPGFFTFAPRFFQDSTEPTNPAPSKDVHTVPPFDPERPPESLSGFAREFVRDAAQIGARIAPTYERTNWHLDGWDYRAVMEMNILWGTYINALPEGDMGNLLVYPGTHHLLAHVMRHRGGHWMYDGRCQAKPPQSERPSLAYPSLCEQTPFQLCVEAGDVLLAHPWLAHGIGRNTSDQHRLAAYCRLSSEAMWWPPDKCQRCQIAGQSLGPKPWTVKGGDGMLWTGDPWAGIPFVNEWVKKHPDKVDAYDRGVLRAALEELRAHPDAGSPQVMPTFTGTLSILSPDLTDYGNNAAVITMEEWEGGTLDTLPDGKVVISAWYGTDSENGAWLPVDKVRSGMRIDNGMGAGDPVYGQRKKIVVTLG
jgi:hypothetical protein